MFEAVVSKVQELEKPDLLRATKIRHTKSNYVGTMELDANVMDRFFDHMGHDPSINKQVYRAPPAIDE